MSVPGSNPIVIPLIPSNPNYRVTTTIGGDPYIFDVLWNVRDGAWYFDLLNPDETPIAYGLKIVIGTSIGRRIKHPLFQAGAFMAKDLSNQYLDAGLDDMGVRVQLRYYTVFDIMAAVRFNQGMG